MQHNLFREKYILLHNMYQVWLCLAQSNNSWEQNYPPSFDTSLLEPFLNGKKCFV